MLVILSAVSLEMTCFPLTEVLSTITAPVESTIFGDQMRLVVIASASKDTIRGSHGQR